MRRPKKLNLFPFMFLGVVIIFIIVVFMLICLCKPSVNRESFEVSIDNEIIDIDHKLYGKLKMVSNDLITTDIGTDRIWEPHVVEVLAEHYVPGTDVLDIGCHSGLSILGMNRLKPITGIAHCIEAQSRQCEIIKYNLKDKINYRLYNTALTDTPKMMCFDTVKGNTGSTGMQVTETKTCVSAIRLDDMLPFFKNRVSVVKIDVEGHEYHIINSGRKFLSQNRPVIEIEIEIEINTGGEEHFSKMIKLFEELGYKLKKKMEVWDYVFIPVDK